MTLVVPFQAPSPKASSKGCAVFKTSTLRLCECFVFRLPSPSGVDIVLSGHIHTYERSVLLDSHYGPPRSYKARCHAKDSGTGSVVDPYNKPPGVSSHGGTVYIVLGCSGTVDQTGASVGAEIPEMVVRAGTVRLHRDDSTAL